MQRRSLWIAGGATLLVLALGGIGAQKMAGPRLDAYQVVAQPLVQTVVATGRVTAPARVQVGSPITGVVLQRHVREGDRVRPGEVLAVLRADDLQAQVRQARAALTELQQSTRPQAQRAVQQTQQQWQQARRELERRRLLASQQAISHEALEQAIEAETLARLAAEQAQLQARALQPGQSQEASAQARLASAQAQLDKATIRAEVAGTVLTRHAEPGDLVQPGQVLFEMAGDGTTEVLVALDEKNLEVLALGQSARCIADAYPRQPFAAELDFIAPSIDPQRGTVEVRLAVAAAPDFLRQDMTVSVNIQTGAQASAIVVPNDALANLDGERPHVWVVEQGRVVRRELQLGLRGLVQTQVTAGLQAGDWVLADAQPPLEPGQRVRVLERPLPWAAP
ncbi:efflux RND transporter periplasmic adaptor subunit [Comamonas denitrificans]|uniref:Efflux RND transporter periplasmic adaptor subunit n=1 Tax=Comamonas denitrificans TaxID=117506 RepID=A0A939KFS1_9BURK|nr:efflux RND transporter periplasmic adaptor subunit [Comamonas denitrificans]MBO1250698.1 efflux RND transporter periplasmic adaptor subunit [Comamonas denitrificans]